MTDLSPKTDQMVCRSCGRQERASEGYPCEKCGKFICVLCNLQGFTLCRTCRDEQPAS